MYAKFFASLAAPTAFTFAADLMAQYEGSNAGATWAHVFDDPFPMAAILGCVPAPVPSCSVTSPAALPFIGTDLAVWLCLASLDSTYWRNVAAALRHRCVSLATL